jgi:hypothetical protein
VLQIRQHTSACVSGGTACCRCVSSRVLQIRQHTSAYVSIRQRRHSLLQMRQHTSAYVKGVAWECFIFDASADVSIRLHQMRQQTHLSGGTECCRYVSIRQRSCMGLCKMRQHTSAYRVLQIRQHTSKELHGKKELQIRHTSKELQIGQHTSADTSADRSAYDSIRQHTSAYVSIRQRSCIGVHYLMQSAKILFAIRRGCAAADSLRIASSLQSADCKGAIRKLCRLA